MPTVYLCLTCNDETELPRAEMVEHLVNVHNLQQPLTYKRTPTLFLDGGKGFHQQHAELDFGAVKILQKWSSE